MKNRITLLAVFICLFSCNQREEKHLSGDNALLYIKPDSLKAQKEKRKDTLLQKTLYPGSDTLFFNLKMDSINKHLTIPVSISSGKELFATLSSNDKKANIRISQIGFPDNTFDGPFGQNIKYKIKAEGNYKIIIGENMMAGEPWAGDFNLKVWVK